MKVAALAVIAILAFTGTSVAQDRTLSGRKTEQPLEPCSAEFWRRALTVATGHGINFELEARQIGRDRCDCKFEFGNPRVCEPSRVSEADAVPPELDR